MARTAAVYLWITRMAVIFSVVHVQKERSESLLDSDSYAVDIKFQPHPLWITRMAVIFSVMHGSGTYVGGAYDLAGDFGLCCASHDLRRVRIRLL